VGKWVIEIAKIAGIGGNWVNGLLIGAVGSRKFMKVAQAPMINARPTILVAPIWRAVSQQPSAAERIPSFSSQSSLQDRLKTLLAR
jgi:hypothetical protein